MAKENDDVGVFVPEIFSNPKPPKDVKWSSEKTKKTSDIKSKEPEIEAETGENDFTPFKKTPPVDRDVVYCFHYGETIPDPYRPLENIPKAYSGTEERNKNAAQLWVNYQMMKTREYLDDDKTREKIKSEISKYWSDKDEEALDYRAYPPNDNQSEGLWLNPEYKTTEGQLAETFYELKSKSNSYSKLTRLNKNGDKETVIDAKYYDSSYEIDEVRISPNQNYAYCIFNISGNKHNRRKYIIDLNDKTAARKLSEPDRENFKAWHPYLNGFYYRTVFNENENLKDIRISAICYHDLNGSTWDEDQFVIDEHEDGRHYTSFDIDVGFYNENVGGRSLLLHKRKSNKYEKILSDYIIHPEQPHVIIPVPNKSKRCCAPRPRVVGIDDTYLYAVLEHHFRKLEIVKLKHDGNDWDDAKVLVRNIQADQDNSIIFLNDKFISVEAENLQNILRIYSIEGNELFSWKPDTASKIRIFMCGDNIQIHTADYKCPLRVYRLDCETFEVGLIYEENTPEYVKNASICIEYAMSDDGTEVPLTIIKQKNTKIDEKTPIILYGYGGFGSCQCPRFDEFIHYWINQGGVYAFAHIRGDSGWEENWAESGAGLNKHNTFDDFNACARYLIHEKGISRKKLISRGMSNGGLTVIAAMQKASHLYAGVISEVPVLDMFNLSMKNNDGCATIYIENYGSPYTVEGYEHLKTYSPLQNIKSSNSYSPTLVMTCGDDKNVDPAHALKYVATIHDRAEDSRCYLHWKDTGGHCDIYRDTWNHETSFEAYTDLVIFIKKCIGEI